MPLSSILPTTIEGILLEEDVEWFDLGILDQKHYCLGARRMKNMT